MKVTKQNLEDIIESLNWNFNDRLFVLNSAYGGFALHCLLENDKTKRVSITLHMSKGDLLSHLEGMLNGIRAYKYSTDKPV